MLAVQGSFAAVSGEPLWKTRTRRGRRRLSPPPSPRLSTQLKAAERWLADSGLRAARWVEAPRRQWEVISARASDLLGKPLDDLRELLDADLLAAVFENAVRLDGDGPLSSGTLGAWRGALRLLARTGSLGDFEKAEAVLSRAFRQASVRHGDCYVMRAGRSPDQGYRPPMADVQAVLNLACRPDQGFVGAMVATTMALSLFHGLRSVSLVAVDGCDLDGQSDIVRLRVREKFAGGPPRYRHIELRPQVVSLLECYVHARNAAFQAAGSRLRVGPGVPGPLFRGFTGTQWTHERLTSTYEEYCRAVGVRPFTPHCLRRVYGTRMVALIGYVDAAVAGGWRDPSALLSRYAGPAHDFQPHLLRDEPSTDLDDALPGAPEVSRKEDERASTVGRNAARGSARSRRVRAEPFAA